MPENPHDAPATMTPPGTDQAAIATRCTEALSALGGDHAASPSSLPRGPAPPAPGTSLGHYLLLRHIAAGSMGVVYEALDRHLDRKVALKLLRTDQGITSEDLERFHIESAAAARLRHPNIVPVYDVDRKDGIDFYTMELIEGSTFDVWLRAESRTYRERAETIAKVARAIQHAHDHGIVHRDLKPANVLIDPQHEPHITDFGLARSVAHESAVTLPGRTVGTPAYMSPEQAQGLQVGPRSDVWGLGAMFYDALTGRPPFVGESAYVVMTAVVAEEPPLPRRLDRSIPAELEAIVLQCLEKRPERRYASASDLAADITRFLNGEPVRARRIGMLGRMVKRVRKHRLPVALGCTIAVVALAFAAYALVERKLSRADWTVAYAQRFTDASNLGGVEFWNQRMDTPITPWRVDQHGLEVTRFEWLWLKDVRLTGDVRVTATLSMPEPDGVEICIGSRKAPLPFWYWVPPGYSCQFGGYRGASDFISRNPEAQIAGINAAVPSRWRPAAIQTVVLQRRGETLEMRVDGQLVQRDEDPLPLSGRGLDSIGLRTFSSTLRLLSLTVERLALPEKASPLIAGDSLVECGQFDDAVARYRIIASDHPRTQLAESALTKAYFAARRSSAGDPSIATAVRAILDRDFPDCRYRGRLIELDAMNAWLAQDHAQAIGLLKTAFSYDPDTRMALRLLSSKQPGLPEDAATALLEWVGRTSGVHSLDVSGMSLRNLAGIQHLHPVNVRCSDNHLESLEPLRGMALEDLTCSGNRIQDLGPVSGMPLKSLSCDDNLVSDLAPLRGNQRLRSLFVTANPLTSLAPLEGIPLTSLMCTGDRIGSLAGLAGAPLTFIECGDCGISDIGPLTGAPLEHLACEMNQVVDLAPLAGMSTLREVILEENRIVDLSPLAGLSLIELGVSGNEIADLSPLAGSRLKHLDCCDNRIVDLSPLADCSLDTLLCAGNPITSLAPLLAHPPETFLYDDGRFPAAEIERARERWLTDGSHAGLAEQARTVLEARRGDVTSLLTHAARLSGHAYIFVPLCVTWEEASARCQALGGHLASITSLAEQEAVIALVAPRAAAWIGLRHSRGEARWEDGEAATFQKYPSIDQLKKSGPVRLDAGNGGMWFARDNPHQRLPFMMEWDDPDG